MCYIFRIQSHIVNENGTIWHFIWLTTSNHKLLKVEEKCLLFLYVKKDKKKLRISVAFGLKFLIQFTCELFLDWLLNYFHIIDIILNVFLLFL